MFLLLAQAFTPGDCFLTGLCGVRPPEPGLPSGVMFLALGLVLGGAAGLRRLRRRDSPSEPRSLSIRSRPGP